ncbi:MAG: methionyl-tRNA formyltransferase [Patescibacteria group bacterium]
MTKTKEEYRIIFFGTPDFAVPPLEALISQNYEVVACVTKPDTTKGRDLKLSASPVKNLALKHNIPVLQPDKIKDDNFYQAIKNLRPDIIIVVAYGKILPLSILEIPFLGCLNIHASLLPFYRGPSPIHYALLNQEKETGLTLMKMDEHMDTGPILCQEKIKISENDDFESLHNKLAKLGAKLLIETLPLYLNNKIRPRPQNESQATYTKIIKKEDGRLDFNRPASVLAGKIRASNPWPGAFCVWQGKNLKILKASVLQEKSEGHPGQVMINNGKIFVSTEDKMLEIKTLQLEARKVLSAKDFVIGYPEIKEAVLT